MRKLAIIALTISLFAACSSSYETVRKATISGTITNPKSEVITFRKGDVSETDSLSETGSFEVTFVMEEAGEIRFSHGGERGTLYARPGDAIVMSLDTDEFDETLVFTGDAADINNYLAAMTLLSDSLPTHRDIMIRDEIAFLKVQDSIKELKIGYLKTVSDEEFKTLVNENLYWETYSERLEYEMSHEYYLGLPLDDFSVSDDFYSFITALDNNDSSKLIGQFLFQKVFNRTASVYYSRNIDC